MASQQQGRSASTSIDTALTGAVQQLKDLEAAAALAAGTGTRHGVEAKAAAVLQNAVWRHRSVPLPDLLQHKVVQHGAAASRALLQLKQPQSLQRQGAQVLVAVMGIVDVTAGSAIASASPSSHSETHNQLRDARLLQLLPELMCQAAAGLEQRNSTAAGGASSSGLQELAEELPFAVALLRCARFVLAEHAAAVRSSGPSSSAVAARTAAAQPLFEPCSRLAVAAVSCAGRRLQQLSRDMPPDCDTGVVCYVTCDLLLTLPRDAAEAVAGPSTPRFGLERNMMLGSSAHHMRAWTLRVAMQLLEQHVSAQQQRQQRRQAARDLDTGSTPEWQLVCDVCELLPRSIAAFAEASGCSAKVLVWLALWTRRSQSYLDTDVAITECVRDIKSFGDGLHAMSQASRPPARQLTEAVLALCVPLLLWQRSALKQLARLQGAAEQPADSASLESTERLVLSVQSTAAVVAHGACRLWGKEERRSLPGSDAATTSNSSSSSSSGAISRSLRPGGSTAHPDDCVMVLLQSGPSLLSEGLQRSLTAARELRDSSDSSGSSTSSGRGSPSGPPPKLYAADAAANLTLHVLKAVLWCYVTAHNQQQLAPGWLAGAAQMGAAVESAVRYYGQHRQQLALPNTRASLLSLAERLCGAGSGCGTARADALLTDAAAAAEPGGLPQKQLFGLCCSLLKLAAAELSAAAFNKLLLFAADSATIVLRALGRSSSRSSSAGGSLAGTDRDASALAAAVVPWLVLLGRCCTHAAALLSELLQWQPAGNRPPHGQRAVAGNARQAPDDAGEGPGTTGDAADAVGLLLRTVSTVSSLLCAVADGLAQQPCRPPAAAVACKEAREAWAAGRLLSTLLPVSYAGFDVAHLQQAAGAAATGAACAVDITRQPMRISSELAGELRRGGHQLSAGAASPQLLAVLAVQQLQRVQASADVQRLPARLHTLGACLSGLPLGTACNNPACGELRASSERRLVSSGSVCSGCRVARYCCGACQRQHWQGVHKGVCKAMAAAKAAAQAAAADQA